MHDRTIREESFVSAEELFALFEMARPAVSGHRFHVWSVELTDAEQAELRAFWTTDEETDAVSPPVRLPHPDSRPLTDGSQTSD